MESITLNIGQLAKRSATAADTLRYYERLRLLVPTSRSGAGYRRYDESALERLGFIRRAQALGLTLTEVREIIDLAERGAPPCAHVKETLVRHLRDVDARINALRALRRDIAGLLARESETGVSEACVCGLIESIQRPKRPAKASARSSSRSAGVRLT